MNKTLDKAVSISVRKRSTREILILSHRVHCYVKYIGSLPVYPIAQLS